MNEHPVWANHFADAYTVPATSTSLTVDHCSLCGSTSWENLNTGDQGYTACCNEPVISKCDENCDHS